MDGTPGRGKSLQNGRGQTGFDFLVGMSVFLVTVGLVFTFAPGMFEPFTTEAGPHMIVADRSAARLVGDVLVESPDRPGVLNETCTVEFFDGAGSIPSGCRFETHDVNEVLGLDSNTRVNVTILDGGTVETVGTTELHSGPSPDGTDSVIASQRMVVLDGNQSRLLVKVW